MCCDEHKHEGKKDDKPVFHSIRETRLCQYEAQICVPKLCHMSPSNDSQLYALIRDAVVAEDSKDLRFARQLKFVTALDHRRNLIRFADTKSD